MERFFAWFFVETVTGLSLTGGRPIVSPLTPWTIPPPPPPPPEVASPFSSFFSSWDAPFSLSSSAPPASEFPAPREPVAPTPSEVAAWKSFLYPEADATPPSIRPLVASVFPGFSFFGLLAEPEVEEDLGPAPTIFRAASGPRLGLEAIAPSGGAPRFLAAALASFVLVCSSPTHTAQYFEQVPAIATASIRSASRATYAAIDTALTTSAESARETGRSTRLGFEQGVREARESVGRSSAGGGGRLRASRPSSARFVPSPNLRSLRAQSGAPEATTQAAFERALSLKAEAEEASPRGSGNPRLGPHPEPSP